MKTILFLLTSLFSLSLLAQQAGNYIPLEFTNLTPSWIHTSVDSTIIGHLPEEYRDLSLGFDGYSHITRSDNIERAPLIVDDYLYIISRTRYDIDVSGGLIEKIDMNTGEKIWQNTFDLRTSSYREFIERTIIKHDTLILINYKITVPDSPINYFPFVAIPGFGGEGVLKVRKYDTATGTLISEQTANAFAPNVKKLQVGSDDRAQINLIEDDLLEVIEFTLDHDGIKLLFDTINYDGLLVNGQDTVFSSLENADWKNSWFYLGNRVKKSKDGVIYWIDGIVPNDNTQNHNVFLEIIKDKVKTRVSLNELPIENDQVNRWYIEDVTDNYLMLRIGYYNDNEPCDYIVLDRDGNFVQRLEIDYCNTKYPYLNQNSEFVSMSLGRDPNGHYTMKFRKSVDDGLGSISEFSLNTADYKAWPGRLFPLESGEYLAEINHAERNGNGYLGNFVNYLRVSPEAIGFETVSNKVVGKLSLEFIVYPNPGSGIFTINFDQAIEGNLDLFNSAGQLILSKVHSHMTGSSIDISDQLSGVYYLRFTNYKYTATQKLSLIN